MNLPREKCVSCSFSEVCDRILKSNYKKFYHRDQSSAPFEPLDAFLVSSNCLNKSRSFRFIRNSVRCSQQITSCSIQAALSQGANCSLSAKRYNFDAKSLPAIFRTLTGPFITLHFRCAKFGLNGNGVVLKTRRVKC